MKQSIVEVHGKRYMNTYAAAVLWNVSVRTVRDYCLDGKIPGVFKDTSKHWCIPINSIKPLTDWKIKKILFLSLELMNNSTYSIDYQSLGVEPNCLLKLYQYLRNSGFVKPFNEKENPASLPYRIRLTEKGMHICRRAVSTKTKKDILQIVREWCPIVLQLISMLQ